MTEQNLLDYSLFKPNVIHNSLDGNANLPFTLDYAMTTEQRKIPTNTNHSNSFFLPPINAVFMQPKEQWKNKSAIVINEKIQQVTIPIQQKNINTPTHIVSPEAIREALQEEKEEAMGKTNRLPFSQFSSFHALKQRRYSSTIEEEEDDDIDTKSKQKQEKLKRPPNAYLLFNRDMRRRLLSTGTKMSVAEISKEVGDGWKSLPDEQKEYYIKEASLLKQEHLKKYPGFIYTRRSKAQLAEDKKTTRKLKSDLQPKKQMKKPQGQRDPRGRKKKRQKHPFAPKHPMSAFLYYLASVYPKVSSNFPGSTVGPISKSISKTWHAMSLEERLPWTQKAELDKARYAREMQVYMATQAEQPKLELSEEEVDDEDMDLQTLEAVVNMVNHKIK